MKTSAGTHWTLRQLDEAEVEALNDAEKERLRNLPVGRPKDYIGYLKCVRLEGPPPTDLGVNPAFKFARNHIVGG